MTQEEKQLLLKDLCARLPYGVKCDALLKQIDGSLKSIFGTFKGYNGWANIGNNLVDIETVKPYLRPMSSMTSDEKMEWFQMRQNHCNMSGFNELRERADFTSASLDWLNSHYFDFRGLIPMGLAWEAKEGMYKI
jgi:hypothetical protein